MRILRHVAKSFAMRPLAIAALGLMAGALVDSGAGEPCQWAAVAVVAALLIPAVARCYKRRRVPCVALEVALFAIVLALFAGVGGLRASSSRTEFVMTEEACSLSGTVTMVSRRDSMRTRVVLAADTLAGETFRAAGIGVMVDIPATALPDSSPVSLCGRRLALTGRTCVPYPDPLSDFDYLEYLRSSGVSAMVKAQTVRQLASEGMSVAAMAGAVNEWFTRSLVAAGVSEPNIGFLKALVLADRSTLPPDVRQSFSACGTSHVLAVSGLHVGVLSGAVVWLLSLFAGRRVAAGVSVPVVWLYVLLAGASPSIVRSAVMFSFLSAEVALGRRLPSFHSLWAALCVIVFADPTAASSVSLWLSFAAVGGLLAAMPVFKGWLQERPWPVRAFLSGLIVSVAAQLATLPALLYVFHSVPVYFWLNNLVV
ncbi:ComEC family competence protein, partial [Salmonella enterica]|nr:ComEC family competence protein [Salmonella enterica]